MPLIPGDSLAGLLVVFGFVGALLHLRAIAALGSGWGWAAATAS